MYRVGLCTELFMLPSLSCFFAFADLLSLHPITFLMFYILVIMLHASECVLSVSLTVTFLRGGYC